MKNILNSKYFKIFLFITPFLLNLVFFFYFVNRAMGDRFINVLDSGILFTKIEVQKKFITLWGENNLGFINSLFTGMGFFPYLYSFILLKFNLSIKWIELIIYFIGYTGIFYSSWYAFYLIQKKVFKKNNIFLPFIAAFFYSYNIFNVTFIIGLIDQFFLLQILLPYLLYILIILLDGEINLKYVLAFSLIIGFTITVPIFSFGTYICLFIPFFFLKKNFFSIKNILFFLIIFIFAFLLAIPLIYTLFHAYTAPNPYSTNTVNLGLTAYIFPPYGIMGLFQFFFHWVVASLNTYSNLYIRSVYGLTSSYMIWILILMILVTYWKSIKNKRVLLFLLLSLILGMFLYKGGQKPFEEINMLIYALSPLFAIFRTPGSKFGIPIMMIISALILYALNINKKNFFTILIVITVFMQTWIFFNPINFTSEETIWWTKPLVKISQDYQNLILFINNGEKSGAVLFYPGLSSGHYDLKNGTIFSFQDVLGKYIKRPVIYPDISFSLSLSKRVMTKITKDFDPKLIGNSSIRYIIIRHDTNIRRMNERAEVNKKIKILKTKDFKIVHHSKLFTVFEVDDKYFKDLITIKTPKKEYTPFFKKIAPYHYAVSAKIKDILGSQIIFRNNFHPQWVILDLEKKGLKAKQVLVNNFANGWNIEAFDKKNAINPDQDITLDIYFYPQKYFFIFSYVSLATIFSILILYLFLLIRKKSENI